jgi:hypothetical protein
VWCLQAVQKWCLLVLSALLFDENLRQWALPWGTALQPLQAGTVETLDTLEALVVLLAAGINRCEPWLSQAAGAPCCHSPGMARCAGSDTTTASVAFQHQV